MYHKLLRYINLPDILKTVTCKAQQCPNKCPETPFRHLFFPDLNLRSRDKRSTVFQGKRTWVPA